MDTPRDLDFINLNDIKSGPEAIPAGEYHVKIVEAEVKPNKQGDAYYVNYRVVVQSGERIGSSFFSIWSLKPTAAWKMKKDFKAMQYTPPDGVPHIADLIGFEGIADVSNEPVDKDDPNSDRRNNIKRWIGPMI